MKFTLYSAVLALLAVSTAAAPVLEKRATPVLPTEDPFYTPAPGFESAANGAILRSRPVPGKLAAFQAIPLQPKAAYQILYKSNDTLGNPTASVSTILIPNNADFTKVVSYQVAEDASSINAAPSYVIQAGTDTTYGGTGSIEILLIAAALDQGWVVSCPDWEGLNSTFIAGIGAGQSTLDSIRAALASENITGILPSAKVQMWGYSGGSLASEFAAELQAQYAPELPILGAALGGTTPNIINVLNTINNGLFAGLISAGFVGLANAYPDFAKVLNAGLVPATANTFYNTRNQGFYGDVVQYAGQNMYNYFTNGSGILQTPEAQYVVNYGANAGVHGVPSIPFFVYKAVNDEISPIADTDALVNKLCSKGTKITYVRNSFGEHFIQAATGAGEVLNFLKNNFAGVSPVTTCSTTTVYSDLENPANLAEFSTAFLNVLLNVAGTPIGPGYI